MISCFVLKTPHPIQTAESADPKPAPQAQIRADLAELTHAHFAACVGELFRLHGPQGGTFEIELTSANLLSSTTSPQSSRRKREPFALIFHLPGDSYLPQQIYRVEHARLGELSIFLVPIGPDKKGMRFEAIFT